MSRPSRTPVPAGWEALDRRHRVGLCRYLQALGAAPDQAEDLAQEAFLVALRDGFEDRSDGASGAWLRRTARHLYLRMRRDQGRREELVVEQADRLWERYCSDDGGEAWLAALRGCVEQLGERSRAAVRVFYGEGRDRAAAAAALGMKVNGFKTLLQRLRRKLRACIEQRMGKETGDEDA